MILKIQMLSEHLELSKKLSSLNFQGKSYKKKKKRTMTQAVSHVLKFLAFFLLLNVALLVSD